MTRESITSLTLPQLTQALQAAGQPAYRAKQVYGWLHQHQAVCFAQMSNLPKALQAQLEEHYCIDSVSVARKQVSQDGTVKYLFRLSDGNCVESVVMFYEYGATICLSTQVGCRMGCRFCASTQAGRVRNLCAGEICAQVYAAQRDMQQRISHIVLMGIGEPLDNYDNVLAFLRIITSPEGLCIGMRNISLSTCGLVPGIDRLAQEHLQLTLSISLHAPNDALRSSMMPVNNRYPVSELLAACRRYQKTTGRRISFEYSMVKGVNDSERQADELAALIRGMGAHVNLIPINPVDGSPYSATDARNVARFQKLLQARGVNATIRRRLGSDISAACGQLRREEMQEKKEETTQEPTAPSGAAAEKR